MWTTFLGRVAAVLCLSTTILSTYGCSNKDQGANACSAAIPVDSKHVLVLTIDTLRADHLSSAGYPLLTTPTLDDLSRASTVFKRAVTTSPRTTPALASLFTGRYPHNTGVRVLLGRLSRKATPLAEIASANGFTTIAVVSNHILANNRSLGRGFDRYNAAADHRTAAATTAAVKRTLAALKASDSIFLWVHYIDPHAPYIPKKTTVEELLPEYQGRYSHRFGQKVGGAGDAAYPEDLPKRLAVFENTLPEEVNNRVRQLYAADIRDTDNAVGTLLTWLKKKFGDDWTIVFAADHGESLGERDYFYYDHGDYVYNATTRIPLAIQLPKTQGDRCSGEVNDWVSLVDIAPTLIELLNWQAPSSVTSSFEGRSLTPLLRGESMPPRAVFAECGRSYFPEMIRGRTHFDIAGRFRAVWKGDWKLIWTPFAPPDQEYQLYNVTQDPDELENIAADHPREVSELRMELAQWLRNSKVKAIQPTPTQEDLDSLRALGYIE